MESKGKHLVRVNRWTNYEGEFCMRKELRRISRETRTQLISDTQRDTTWRKKLLTHHWFQKIAHRYRKNKLFMGDGSFSNYYGNMSWFDNNDLSRLISDTPFDEMFHVTQETNLFERILASLKKKTFTFPCILDDTQTGVDLQNLFGLPVYFIDSMFTTGKHTPDGESKSYRNKYKLDCKYDRNIIFHQLTIHGTNDAIITNEMNKDNKSMFIFVFEDKVLWRYSAGRDLW